VIPKRIHQIWIGGLLPDAEARMVETVGAMNPTFRHTLWDDRSLRSIGLDVEALMAKYELPNLACASSLLRLELLNRFGGIYADCDCECLKPLDSLLDYSAFAAEQDGGRICNAVVGAEPGHSWVDWQLRHLGDFDIKDGAAWIYLMTAAPRDGLTIIPQHWVYPWLWMDAPEKRIPANDSLLQHLWSGSWTK
jgi:mannosyltransferase OCH1-like enzyme